VLCFVKFSVVIWLIMRTKRRLFRNFESHKFWGFFYLVKYIA